MSNGMLTCTLNKRGYIPIICKTGPLNKPFRCTKHQYDQLKTLGYDIKKVKINDAVVLKQTKVEKVVVVGDVVLTDDVKKEINEIVKVSVNEVINNIKEKEDVVVLKKEDIKIEDKPVAKSNIKVKKVDEIKADDWSFDRYTKGRLRPKSRPFIEKLLKKEGLSVIGNKAELIQRLSDFREELEGI